MFSVRWGRIYVNINQTKDGTFVKRFVSVVLTIGEVCIQCSLGKDIRQYRPKDGTFAKRLVTVVSHIGEVCIQCSLGKDIILFYVNIDERMVCLPNVL